MANSWLAIRAARIVCPSGKPVQVSTEPSRHFQPIQPPLIHVNFVSIEGMFGLGQSQTRCIKGYSTAPIPDVTRLNPMRLAKLIWINNRTVTLMLADGSETRFNV